MAIDPLEALSAALSALAVWLTVRQRVACWPVGAVSVALYAVVFYRTRLYADAGLQIVYFAFCLYGWWAWQHGGRDRGPLAVSRVPVRAAAALAGAAVAATAGIGWLLASGTDASFPFLDSSLAAASLAAQWMQTRKWLENWAVWVAVDAVYVGLYLAKGMGLTALLYAGFLALAVAGWVEWRRAPAVAELPSAQPVTS